MRIRTVTVLGANGTMGCNVAGIFASFGGAKVYMVSRSMIASEAACKRAGKSVRAGAIEGNLIPADYSMIEDCVCESDLVFESVSEDIAAKLDVWAKVANHLRPDALACTGTSGLSVNVLASALPEVLHGRFAGMHFFNPPYAMRLCEFCPSQHMDRGLADEIKEYLEGRLYRVVVEVADAPAFLGNRIGFEFINRTMQLAEEEAERGGIDYMDAIMGPFTGRAMAPLNTADFVGLDVHAAIVDNVFVAAPGDVAHEAFALPAFCRRLVEEGRLGRKAEGLGGLYRLDKTEDGKKVRVVYDIAAGGCYRPVRHYELPFAVAMSGLLRVGNYAGAMRALVDDDSHEAQLCLSLLCEYIVYSLIAATEVSDDVHAADDVMAAGFNWCPPLAMAEALSLAGGLREIVGQALRPELCSATDLDGLLGDMPASRYDYRRYFRAAK